MMSEYIHSLENEFQANSNASIAAGQKAYLRNQFEFFGIKTTDRRALQKLFLQKAYLPPKENLAKIVTTLWKRPEREYHYFSQELVSKYAKGFEKTDIELLEYMVVHHSWWDTVDFIASSLMGQYFKIYPEQRQAYVDKWIASQNMWLQRSALLFQLKYKAALDKELLQAVINQLLGSKDFFINKAIGWVLREYSKTDPEWVINLAAQTDLSTLSNKEALRLVKAKIEFDKHPNQ